MHSNYIGLNPKAEDIFFKVLSQSQTKVEPYFYEQLDLQIKKYGWLLSSLPFCEEVAICNNYSFKIVNENSDIDLFLILKSDRFFTARLIITLLFQLFGVRRRADCVKQRFCLSFYVSDKNLNLSDLRLSDKDYYFYFWFKNLVFTRGNVDLQERLLSENNWFYIEKFKFRDDLRFKKNFFAKSLECILSFSCFNFIEKLLASYQLNRALKKNNVLGNPKGVIIKDGLLKFHVKDKREAINQEVDAYLSLLR